MGSHADLECFGAKAAEVTLPQSEVIPVEFVSCGGRLANVVNNPADGVQEYKFRDDEIEIKLLRPIFVTEISLTLASYENVRGMRLVAHDLISNKRQKISITVEKVSGASVRFIINRAVTSFTLCRESIFPKHIKAIQVTGIFLERLQEFENAFSSLNELRQEISDFAGAKLAALDERDAAAQIKELESITKVAAAELRLSAISSELQTLDERKVHLKNEVAELANELDEKSRADVKLGMKIDELEKRTLALQSELEQRTQSLTTINSTIVGKENRLKTLTEDISVFAEEFSVFVAEGATQSRIYIALAAVPLLLLSAVVANLFNGAVDLSTKFEALPSLDIVTLLLTRLPYVAVATLLIATCMKVLLFLLGRIIAIHQRKLDLAAIAIIAKDVSDASSARLDMSVEEQYEAKTYLKMSILRSYLAEQIHKFSYPKRSPNAAAAVVETEQTSSEMAADEERQKQP